MFGRPSQWTFETAGSAGVNVDIFAANGGELKLRDPAGQEHAFCYGGAGVGIRAGLKLPKFSKIELRPKQLGKAIGGTVAGSG